MKLPGAKWLRIAGGSLGFLGVIFVCAQLAHYGERLELARIGASGWMILALFGALYGASNVLLAEAWRQVLRFVDIRVRRGWALRTFGVAQLAKYVPGNVIHLASRQALGMADGLMAGPLAKSALWELGLMVIAASTFLPIVAPFVWRLGWPVATTACCTMLVVTLSVLHAKLSSHVARAVACQFAFLAVSGLVFAGVLDLVNHASLTGAKLPFICGAYVLAWLAGFVVPGAPAGVGIRELVLFYFLKDIAARDDLILAIVLGRAVTVVGDLALYGVAAYYAYGHSPGRTERRA